MDEELQLREGVETEMATNDEMATFDPTEDMSDDDVAAALGYATSTGEQFLPQDDMTTAEGEEVETADESPETAAEAEEAAPEEPEEETDPIEEEVADIRKELEELKASIENDDEEGETEENTEASG